MQTCTLKEFMQNIQENKKDYINMTVQSITEEEVNEILSVLLLTKGRKAPQNLINILRKIFLNLLKENIENRFLICNMLNFLVEALRSSNMKIRNMASYLLLQFRPLNVEYKGTIYPCIVDDYVGREVVCIAEHLFNISSTVRKNITELLRLHLQQNIGEIKIMQIYTSILKYDEDYAVRREALCAIEPVSESCDRCDKKFENLDHAIFQSHNCIIICAGDSNLSVRSLFFSKMKSLSLKHLSFNKRIFLLEKIFTERELDVVDNFVEMVDVQYDSLLEILLAFCFFDKNFIEENIEWKNINFLRNRNLQRENNNLLNLPPLIYSRSTIYLKKLFFKIFKVKKFTQADIQNEHPTIYELILLRLYNEFLYEENREAFLFPSQVVYEEVYRICKQEIDLLNEESFITSLIKLLELFKLTHFYPSYETDCVKYLVSAVYKLFMHHCSIFKEKKQPVMLALYSNGIGLLFAYAISLLVYLKYEYVNLLGSVIDQNLHTIKYNTALLNILRNILLYINSKELLTAIYEEGIWPYINKTEIMHKNYAKIKFGLDILKRGIRRNKNMIADFSRINKKKTTIKEINAELFMQCYFIYQSKMPSVLEEDLKIIPFNFLVDLFLCEKIKYSALKERVDFTEENVESICKMVLKLEFHQDRENILQQTLNIHTNEDEIFSYLHFILYFYFERREKSSFINFFINEYCKRSDRLFKILPYYCEYYFIVEKDSSKRKILIDYFLSSFDLIDQLIYFLHYILCEKNYAIIKILFERAHANLSEKLCSIITEDELNAFMQTENDNDFLCTVMHQSKNLKIKIILIFLNRLMRISKDNNFKKVYFHFMEGDDGKFNERLQEFILNKFNL